MTYDHRENIMEYDQNYASGKIHVVKSKDTGQMLLAAAQWYFYMMRRFDTLDIMTLTTCMVPDDKGQYTMEIYYLV